MSQASALKLVPLADRHPFTGQPVLESAPLRQGFHRTELSHFEDSTWDLSPAVFRENARRTSVTAHFAGIQETGVERTLREFLYARLNFDIPGHCIRLPPASIRRVFDSARRFLEFAAERQGCCDLSLINQALLDEYRSHLAAGPRRGAMQVARLLEVVANLYHYREHMPSGGLGFLPWNGRSALLVSLVRG